jgi:hypothetical protein
MVNGQQKPVQADYVVEDSTRELAMPLGIRELLQKCSSTEPKLVPDEALAYFLHDSGHLQFYEILSEMENRWGITFGIQTVQDVAATPPPAQTNGYQRQIAATPAQAELPDLDAMLKNHLKALSDRNAVLSEELKRKQAEYDRNNADIMRISQMIVVTNPDPEAFRIVATDVKLAPSKPAKRPRKIGKIARAKPMGGNIVG